MGSNFTLPLHGIIIVVMSSEVIRRRKKLVVAEVVVRREVVLVERLKVRTVKSGCFVRTEKSGSFGAMARILQKTTGDRVKGVSESLDLDFHRSFKALCDGNEVYFLFFGYLFAWFVMVWYCVAQTKSFFFDTFVNKILFILK